MRNDIGKHLSEFGLINMNGRVYDPVLGRFLSPDPFVQMPGTVSGYNRYAYVHNNPLTYIDPTGYRRNKPMSAGLQEFYAFMKEYNSGAGGGLGHLLGRGFDYSKYKYGGHFGWHGGAFNPFYRYNYKKGKYETHLGQEVSYAQVHNNIVIQNIDRNAKLIVWTYNGRGSYVDNKSAVRASPIGSLYVFSFFEYDKAYDINVASSGGGDPFQPGKGGEHGTLKDFVDRYEGKTYDEIIKKGGNAKYGYKNGTILNYVEDLLTPGKYIDMTHMLIVGRKGALHGLIGN